MNEKQATGGLTAVEELKKGLVHTSVEIIKKKVLSPKNRFRALVRKVIANIDWLGDDDGEEGEEEGSNLAKLNRIMLRKEKRDQKSLLALAEKSILMKDKSERTDEEKRRICFVIGGLKCFRRYPEDVQRELAAASYFIYYKQNREVVRQGHEASALYFILEGLVVVSICSPDPLTGVMISKDVGTMEDGDMFGEVSLLHGIPRTATITTAANCNLLCLKREDFDAILKESLQAQWDECKAAMQSFPYFDRWHEVAVRECCILSKMKNYEVDEIILGDDVGQSAFVYFVLSGECQMTEDLQIAVRRTGGVSTFRRYSPWMPMSPEETVETVYMQVCTMKTGACFCIGEFIAGRTVIALSPVRCLLCPRYWIMQNNRANIWQRIQVYLDRTIPSSQRLFEDFVEQRKWLRYRKSLVADVLDKKAIHSGTTSHDVPYSIRIREHDQAEMPGFVPREVALKGTSTYETQNILLMEKNRTSMY